MRRNADLNAVPEGTRNEESGGEKGGGSFQSLAATAGILSPLGESTPVLALSGAGDIEGPSASTLSLLRQKVNKHSRC